MVIALVGGLVLMALFVLIQARSRHPMLPLRIVADRDRGGIVASVWLVARVMPRTGPKPLMLTGMALASISMAIFATLTAQSSLFGFVIPCLLVMSFGFGMTFVPLNSMALAGADPNDAGVASALLNAAQQLGSAIGVALLNAVYAAWVTKAGGTPETTFMGYRAALTVAAGLFLAGLVAVLVLIRSQPRLTQETS